MGLPIVVTHPSSLFHNGLRNLLAKSRFRPVRIASSLSEELEEYLRSQPNCVWLTGVEGSLGITNALVRKVTAANGGVKAVILAASQEPEEIIAALQAGACGFLSQDIPAERLLRSLELIALGEMIVHPHVAWRRTANENRPDSRESEFSPVKSAGSQRNRRFDQRFDAPYAPVDEGGQTQGDDVVPSLSRREMLILRMLMQGASNKAIARNLVITESTVKVHMKAILRKLRLQNRTQAAIWARNHVDETNENQRTANGGPAH
jgi:two-component system nitrate/nitrite response regulator NarL